MNTNHIHQLADHIATLDPSQFDMSVYYTHPNRPCCVWGHAEQLFGIDSHRSLLNHLGLTFDQWSDISVSHYDGFHNITPTVAATCLRNLATTGEVDWLKAGATKQ